jgi:hypothetical protein
VVVQLTAVRRVMAVCTIAVKVNQCVLDELKRIIEDSEIMKCVRLVLLCWRCGQ